jgi:hypothetical protein
MQSEAAGGEVMNTRQKTLAGATAAVALAGVIGYNVVTDREPAPTTTKRRAVGVSSNVRPDTIPMDVIAIPINYEPGPYRMNVYVMTLPDCRGNDLPGSCFPSQAWSNPAVRSLLLIEGGLLSLRVYRITPDGRVIPSRSILLGAAPLQSVQFTVGPEFRPGDWVAVQWKPQGLFVHASLIDARSGDQTGVPSTRMRVEIPMR